MLSTTTTLLEGLQGSGDPAAWHRLDQFYRPYLCRYLRRCGVSEADADDVVQIVMLEVQSGVLTRYERGRGRLRHWILGITRNQLARLRACNWAQPQAIGSGDDNRAAVADIDEIAEQEWRTAITRQALRTLWDRKCRLSESKVRAFVATVIHERNPVAVAADLRMTIDDVYRARHLCLRYLKKCRQAFDRYYQGE